MPRRLDLALRHTDRVFPLEAGQTLTAGRTAQCDLHLDDPSVSRRHCTIAFLASGVLQVTDLDSANGTFVNERAVKAATARPGDLIRLGAAILEVRDPSAITARPDQTILGDESNVESVIQKRIEPSSFDWLQSASDAGAAPELALLKRAQRHLSTLHRVSDLLAGARDIQMLSDATLRAILEVLSADRGAIVLRGSQAGGPAEVLAARSKGQASEPFVVSRTLVADVIAQGVSVFAHDASSDVRFADGQSVIGQRVRSVMCVPLRTADEILGALYVDSLSGAGRFNEAELELLAAIGNQAGVALHRVRLMGELERLLLDTIKAIAATIDARDGYTHRHSERVAALTAQLARELGLSDAERSTAELSALLHDVGKIAVSDSILNKPGKLTPEEFDEMRKHPVHGARILGNIQSATVKAVLPGVQYHHEKWDGTGYPEGLKGEAIPFLGRLLGVADFYDALTSARSYRGALSSEETIALISKGAGSHFDPAVAAALVRIYERGELHVDAMPSEIGQNLPRGMIALLLFLAQFYCPMHADQRSDVAGRCPICAMPLVPLPPARFDTYPVDLRVTPTTGGARLRLAVQDPRTRATVRRFAIVHERPLHLFIVGDTLEFFAHEHPQQQPDGVFMIDVALPKTGPYMAVAEFLPEGGTPQTFQQMFTTGHAFGAAVTPALDAAAKTADGVRVGLDASQVRAGDARPLTIRIEDAATGAAVAGLEPYLGAAAHLLLVPADLTEAIHEHPDGQFRDPAVTFTPLVPRPGRYKAWVQFQRAGRVSTVSFVFDVR